MTGAVALLKVFAASIQSRRLAINSFLVGS